MPTVHRRLVIPMLLAALAGALAIGMRVKPLFLSSPLGPPLENIAHVHAASAGHDETKDRLRASSHHTVEGDVMPDYPNHVAYTIDRFEGEIAVLIPRLNHEESVDLARGLLPSEAREGDIVRVRMVDDEPVSIVVDRDETARARERMSTLIQKLVDKNKDRL